MERISKNISYAEATRSDTAKRFNIKNTPNEKQLENMKDVATFVFEPVRLYSGCPIFINSFFRSAALNKVVRGAKNSQHLANEGAAIDIDADILGGVTNEAIFSYILNNLTFDQLIAEGVENGHIEWVHVSYNRGNNRKQVLIMYRENGKSKYIPYTEEILNKFLNK